MGHVSHTVKTASAVLHKLSHPTNNIKAMEEKRQYNHIISTL